MDRMSQWDTWLCSGTIVLHADGTPAACTLELEGVACSGLDSDHLGGVMTCDDLLGADGCEQCTRVAGPEAVDPLRHAVRVGRMTTARRRCRAHLVVVAPRRSSSAAVIDRADAMSPGASHAR